VQQRNIFVCVCVCVHARANRALKHLHQLDCENVNPVDHFLPLNVLSSMEIVTVMICETEVVLVSFGVRS
jgi:hypothetical protein